MSTNRDRLRTSRKAYQRYRRIQAYRHPEPIHAPMPLIAAMGLVMASVLCIGALFVWGVFYHESFEAFLQWAGKAAGAL